MLGSAVIVFREALEAALIVGIIAAATRAMPGRNAWLLAGIASGVLGSLLVAGLTAQIARLAEGLGQELFNAGILGVATLMLAWHNIWMAQHGKQLASDARQLGQAVVSGSREMSALALVVMLAILREGSETSLFLYGLFTGGGESLLEVAGGGVLGLLAGVAAGLCLYAGIVKVPARLFFTATSGLILLMASAMASQVAGFLVQADLLPTLADPLWDSSWLLDDGSIGGRLLHTLIGYDAMPMGIQVAFYLGTMFLVLLGMQAFKPTPTLARS